MKIFIKLRKKLISKEIENILEPTSCDQKKFTNSPSKYIKVDKPGEKIIQIEKIETGQVNN